MESDPVGDSISMRERMEAGELYIADDELAQGILRGIRLAEMYQLAYASEPERARSVLNELLGSVGAGTVVRPPFHVDFGSRIHIGARTFINLNCTALDVAEIRIGDDVQIGPNVQLLTPTHPVDPDLRRRKLESGRPITIGDNVWLGGGAVVLAGVTIGENTVVGAGAVVSRDLPANVLAVGCPARIVREI